MFLTNAEINVTNIRSEYDKVEYVFQEVKQDFKDGNADKAEVTYWKNRLENLLQKMTPEQRSLVMDDFDEIPLVHERVMRIVKLQEAKSND